MVKRVQTVAVLGASQKPERFSNRAIRLLKAHGHRVLPVHPALTEIEGFPVHHDLGDIHESVDTLTVYVGPEIGLRLLAKMIALHPGRVILNPGTESDALEDGLMSAGIPVERACTLVLLNSEQF